MHRPTGSISESTTSDLDHRGPIGDGVWDVDNQGSGLWYSPDGGWGCRRFL